MLPMPTSQGETKLASNYTPLQSDAFLITNLEQIGHTLQVMQGIAQLCNLHAIDSEETAIQNMTVLVQTLDSTRVGVLYIAMVFPIPGWCSKLGIGNTMVASK